MESMDLSNFIAELRRELVEAMAAGAGAELRFQPKDIEIEVQIAAEKKDDGSGKISFKVFGIGAEGGGGVERSSAAIQKVKLTLGLVGRDGKPPLISAESRTSDPA
ncbi:MAG TPA: trypco2 family protein [Allosphingosinicella sp.]|jgi:hypothetical protein|nr:trypco2 family protein [Allosphingosinicella sp.]